MRYEETGSNYSNTVQWGYDDKNNLSSQTQTLNGTSYTTNYSYDNDNRLKQATTGGKSANYTYDVYSRMTGITAKSGSSTVVSTGITYRDPTSATTSTQVYKWATGGTTYTYTYDARGNITAISDGTNTTSYIYDSLDQLTRENNQAAGKTWVYTYDNGGNILSKSEYAYTTGTLGAALDTISYGYGDSSWKDLLTSYDGQLLASDEIGNLANDGTWSYSWQHGRQLKQMSRPDAYGDTEMIRFRYDSSGHRIGKDSGVYHISYSGGEIVYAGETTRTSYSYLGDTLTQVNIDAPTGSTSLHFTYDEIGPMSVTYDGAEYFYLKNAQGDVTGLVNSSGTQVVAYTYDAWGNPLTTTGTMADTLGKLNPFRYRGYVYDTETGLYYLGSRYYNPETGRFINADGQLNDDALGNNMFTYCSNNPLLRKDDGGTGWWVVAGALVGGIIGATAKIVTNVAQGKRWNTGVVGAVIGGAIYGAVIASTGNVAAAAFASSAAESAANEVSSYISGIGKINNSPQKKITKENIVSSIETIASDTVINGAIATGTGLIAGQIIPTNNGWFKPQKLHSSFCGKYAIKSEIQSLVQGGLNMAMEAYKGLCSIGSGTNQRQTARIFPSCGMNVKV